MAITNGYVTLADLKTYLKIDDSMDDTTLERIITSASRSIDRMTNRRFYVDAAATARTYRAPNSYFVSTDDIGSTTDLVAKTDPDDNGVYQTTFTYNADFICQPLNALAVGRPYTSIVLVSLSQAFTSDTLRPNVEVTARWGWPAVPQDIAEACLILSADLYKRKDSIGGVLGLSELGAIRMSPLGRDIGSIVRAYRREFLT